MADNLQKAGIQKLQAGVFSLGWRKGSEVVQVDESKIPPYEFFSHLYTVQKPQFLGKTELKKLIKEGQEIPGVEIVRNPDTLTIK
jgi:tryptophanase